MGRHVITVTIDADGRDKGKQFIITEMPAFKAEKWASRALLAIGQSGTDLGDDVMTAGFSGLVVIGLRAILTLSFADAEPLLDEMMECVRFISSGGHTRERSVMQLPDDIEEVSTILKLRDEVIELHTGFSIAAALSTLGEAAKRAQTEKLSTDTSTSPKPSEP